LNVVPIQMPPLRDRREDIPLLAQAFLQEFAGKNNKPMREIEAEAMDALLAHSWKGNVRELRAAIEGAVVLGRKDRVTLRDLPASIRNPAPSWEAGSAAESSVVRSGLTMEEAEKQLMIKALHDSKGNRTEAARRLGISRRTLHRKLHTYHLEGF
jgi:DNA-binding NtrC family response regulator